MRRQRREERSPSVEPSGDRISPGTPISAHGVLGRGNKKSPPERAECRDQRGGETGTSTTNLVHSNDRNSNFSHSVLSLQSWAVNRTARGRLAQIDSQNNFSYLPYWHKLELLQVSPLPPVLESRQRLTAPASQATATDRSAQRQRRSSRGRNSRAMVRRLFFR